MEKLKQDKQACLLKIEALKKEKEEAERKAELKRQEDKQLLLEAEKAVRELKEREDAAEHKQLDDLKAKKDKQKEKEDEAIELALVAAGAPSASDGDSKADPVDLKTAAMAELRKRRKVTKGKKRADTAEPQKHKFWSASVVEDSGEEGGGASVGLLGTCQIDKGNSHKRRSAECVGFGEAISNITLEPKP